MQLRKRNPFSPPPRAREPAGVAGLAYRTATCILILALAAEAPGVQGGERRPGRGGGFTLAPGQACGPCATGGRATVGFVGATAPRAWCTAGRRWWACSAGAPGGDAAPGGEGAAQAAAERALAKRRRARETPLSQKWFKQRQGVITPAQKRTLNELWPLYGCETRFNQMLDMDEVFGRAASLGDESRRRRVLEVGFGTGDCITRLAEADPQADFFGIELHRASIAAALRDVHEMGLGNVRLCRHDATVVLRGHLAPAPLFDEVYILFPDPWLGDSNADRRIVRSSTVDLLAERVDTGGRLRIATDVEAYAGHVRGVMAEAGGDWRLESEASGPASCEGGGAWGRPRTKYERKAAELGHSVWEFEYVRL